MADPNFINYVGVLSLGVIATIGGKLAWTGLKNLRNNNKHSHDEEHIHVNVALKSDIYDDNHMPKFLTEKRHGELCDLASSKFMEKVQEKFDDSMDRHKKEYLDPNFKSVMDAIKRIQK